MGRKDQITNYFLTGQKGVGKSWLLKRLLRESGMEFCGFCTLPYEIGGNRKGFYFHSLAPVKGYENDAPVSVQQELNACIPVPEVFEGLGCACLRQLPGPLVLMDELGRLEQRAAGFQEAVKEVLDSGRLVLGVLKKEPVPWLETVRNREDIEIFDLDSQSREETFQKLSAVLKKYTGGM